MIEQPHSLWLLPEPGALAVLGVAIREISEKLGGPLFTPHVTLLGRITGSQSALTESTKGLAGEISPFELTVTGHAHSEHYFRAIVLELANSTPLDNALRLAKQAFTRHVDEPFAPHLSLVYGRINRSRAQTALAAILPVIPQTFSVGGIELVSASSETPVESWQSLCTFPLLAAQRRGAGATKSA